jgi:hypothetical protein
MKSLSWRLCVSFVVAILAAGMLLNLWRPLYIVPPYMGATWLAYLVLGLDGAFSAYACSSTTGRRKRLFYW